MTWNHRIIYHYNEHENWYAIHEVYYDEDGSVNGWTQEPTDVMSSEYDEDYDCIEGLRWTLNQMLKALDNPVLDEKELEAEMAKRPEEDWEKEMEEAIKEDDKENCSKENDEWLKKHAPGVIDAVKESLDDLGDIKEDEDGK